MKKVNVLEIAKERLAYEQFDHCMYTKIVNILAPYEGKKLTKREYKKIEETMKTHGLSGVRFNTQYTWQEIEFNTIARSLKFTITRSFKFTLFYLKSPEASAFCLQEFQRCNTWASVGAPERISKIEESIKDKRYERIQRAYDLLLEASEILDNDDLSSYDIPYLYDVESKAGKRLERYPR
jgi:hypothetical protein